MNNIAPTAATRGRVVKAKDTSEKINKRVLGDPKKVTKAELPDEMQTPPQRKPKTKAELLAGGTPFAKINWYYPGGKEAFPHDLRLQFVDKCYPYATGGQLLIDEPTNEYELDILVQKKLPLMKELKYRYAIILRGADVVHVLD